MTGASKNACAVVVALLGFLGACQTTGPSEPVTKQIEGGITAVTLTIPVTDGNYVKAEMYLPAATGSAPGVFVLPTYYVNLNNRPETFDREFAITLAKRGYATLIPYFNIHGVRAYNVKYGPDVLAVSQWFRARPEVMDDRIAAVGFSIGGYHASLLNAVDPATRAVVGYYGVYDNSPFTPYDADRATAPVANAAKVSGAVLLLHGDKDDETGVKTALTYKQKLTDAGKTVELVVYPGDYHRFDRGPTDQMNGTERTPKGNLYRLDAQARDDAWKRTTEWLDKYMR